VGKRGQALVITILALAILTAAAVALSVTARQEVRAARRGVDEVQREAALRGAVNRGIAILEEGRDDPETLLSSLRKYERLEWRPFAPEVEGFPPVEMAIQILDMSARLNVNTASSDQLQNIPGLSERAASKILSWRDEESKDKYGGGPRGYEPKRRPYDTIEELLLVREVDAGRFFGAPTSNATASQPHPPISEWLTTFSGETNTDAEGNPRVDVNSATSDELLTAANRVQQCVTPQQMLTLMEKRRQKQSTSTSERIFRSVSEALREGGIEELRWGPVLDAWTVDRRAFLPSRVNVNTASPAVLKTLPGVTDSFLTEVLKLRAETPEGVSWSDLLSLAANNTSPNSEGQPQQQQQQGQSGGLQPDQMETMFAVRSNVYLIRCLIRTAGSTRTDAVSAMIYWPADHGDPAEILQWRRPDRFPGWTAWYRPVSQDEEPTGGG